jgi:hypothetical protein
METVQLRDSREFSLLPLASEISLCQGADMLSKPARPVRSVAMPLCQRAIVDGVVWIMVRWCWVLEWMLTEWVTWRVVLEMQMLVILVTALLPEVVVRGGCKTKVSEVL